MANKFSLDFRCPQFVDFATELDSSDKDDVFFDCKDYQTPDCAGPLMKPAIVKTVYPSEVEENQLVKKMKSALAFIEHTPKLKVNVVKGKLLTETFSKNMYCQSAFNANIVSASTTAMHKSKSIARLNKIFPGNQTNPKETRKRSSSLNDLRTNKKQTYPMTPMCLKRTITKAKNKVVKSTEEKELEEIARLQKQLIKHLRYNEMSLKRLNLKPRTGTASTTTQAKSENVKKNKGLNPVVGKGIEKETRQNINSTSHAAVKQENLIKSQSTMHRITDKTSKDEAKLKHHPLASLASTCAEVNEQKKNQSVKKQVASKKWVFHSGVMFHDSVKNSNSSSFCAKVKAENMHIGAEEKTGVVTLSKSVFKHKVADGKENLSQKKSRPATKKMSRIQNAKCGIVDPLSTNKKIVGRQAPSRGIPLSENFARN